MALGITSIPEISLPAWFVGVCGSVGAAGLAAHGSQLSLGLGLLCMSFHSPCISYYQYVFSVWLQCT